MSDSAPTPADFAAPGGWTALRATLARQIREARRGVRECNEFQLRDVFVTFYEGQVAAPVRCSAWLGVAALVICVRNLEVRWDELGRHPAENVRECATNDRPRK